MEKNLNNKRKFEIPSLTIIEFTNHDIITSSGEVEQQAWWGGSSGWTDPI